MRFTYIGKQKTHKAKEDQEIMAMIMLVEYSWDVDYIAVPCEDREEAPCRDEADEREAEEAAVPPFRAEPPSPCRYVRVL